jgi:K(+)-stimulated pyrophosphate-energized sodium pump
MNQFLLFIAASGVTAILYSGLLVQKLVRLPSGSEKMQKIQRAIEEGANAYIKRQYTLVAIVACFVSIALFLAYGIYPVLAFLLGAILSAASGIIGMSISVRANVKVSEAAKKGLGQALHVAFDGGTVTGLTVAGLALLSTLATLVLPGGFEKLISLGFGASLISVFARIGGGIYTKAADVGTDMVGKIEAGIPEDDPRNPGVIADNVGDNVGDCAGMAADLFETYVVTMAATIILGNLAFGQTLFASIFPLSIGAISIFASIVGTFFVRLGKGTNIMGALYKGLIATAVVSAAALYPLTQTLMAENPLVPWLNIYFASLIGIAVTFAMVAITEFYTSKKYASVRQIAEASQTGHGTNIISGLSVGMKATAAPVIVICAAVLGSYMLAGLYGVAIASAAMLSLAGIIVAIDAFGPITDNAGGIAEMAGLPEKVREATDALDSVGNTTKAVTKGYAIASAGLAALVLFGAFTDAIGNINFSLSDPLVLIGLFAGGVMTYFFSARLMGAVGNAAQSLVVEIRRQFKEIKGIMKGTAKPEYGKAVDIVTVAALREMAIPALIPVATPIAVGLLLGPRALGGLLVGSIVTGIFVAISMTTGGAAWDNAKKYIEEGNLGGKKGPAHQAAVTGDTVGDPYKDTAGPAINPMIKVANIVALLLAPFI